MLDTVSVVPNLEKEPPPQKWVSGVWLEHPGACPQAAANTTPPRPPQTTSWQAAARAQLLCLSLSWMNDNRPIFLQSSYAGQRLPRISLRATASCRQVMAGWSGAGQGRIQFRARAQWPRQEGDGPGPAAPKPASAEPKRDPGASPLGRGSPQVM